MSSDMKKLFEIDVKVLECGICLRRLRDPRTLDCLHSFCLTCLKKLMSTMEGKLCCSICRKSYKMPIGGLEKLEVNHFISRMLEFTDDSTQTKAPTCIGCSKEASHLCSECSDFLCIVCAGLHGKLSVSKFHRLMTLAEYNKLDEREKLSARSMKCPIHEETHLTVYCLTCKIPICAKCCVTTHKVPDHDVRPILQIFKDYQLSASKLIQKTLVVEEKLEEAIDDITNIQEHLRKSTEGCEREINQYFEEIKSIIEVEHENVLEELNALSTEKSMRSEAHLEQLRLASSNLITLRRLNCSLVSSGSPSIALFATHKSYHRMSSLLRNLPSLEPEDDGILSFMPREGFLSRLETIELGEVQEYKSIDPLQCSLSVGDEGIQVIRGQKFDLTLKTKDSNGQRQAHTKGEIVAILVDQSGKEFVTELTNQRDGSYKIAGVCDFVGKCRLHITVYDRHVKGSPVIVKVVDRGLERTILTKHLWKSATYSVHDICFTNDGLLLACNNTSEILKLDYRSGKLVGNVDIGGNRKIRGICFSVRSRIIMTDNLYREVVICKTDGSYVRRFGRGSLKDPLGVAECESNRNVFVADQGGPCIVQFVKDGSIVRRISRGLASIGDMRCPMFLSVFNKGGIVASDSESNCVQAFTNEGRYLRILGQGRGRRDGQIEYPTGVVVDNEDDVIIASYHKIQIFRNDRFIKRIDKELDGVNYPYGLAVHARHVAVANYGDNSIKIFTY
ncbi:tripartite motif-containing protein 2-like [Anneissia japonica]|uniref:tripartite motif-containing protein 2-like n=1 Tax=Anneissia japonica TaxID=1529436 RepID=UPI001425B76F|nr:tripartite motif-containing protein 2-like [Anneissia japonica]XP_033127447.1 tripartite motif-containing protein 2-like [Anneissia japonica]